MNWRNQINEQLASVSPIIVRQLNIEVLPRVMDFLNKEKNNCSKCNQLYEQLSENIVDLKKVVEDAKLYAQFEDILSLSGQHIRKDHNVLPKGLVFSWMILFGILIGGSAGYLLRIKGEELSSFFLGSGVGLFFGYIIGRIVEYIMNRRKMLF